MLIPPPPTARIHRPPPAHRPPHAIPPHVPDMWALESQCGGWKEMMEIEGRKEAMLES
jgi:hypothetical protein